MKQKKAHHALFILSNTLTIVPYLFFLSVSKEQTLFAVLSFVLYYTFKMTGVFFLQTLPGFTTSALLTISLLSGSIGSIFGIFSSIWASLILPTAALIGLSASWLPPADFMYRQHSKVHGSRLKNDWRGVLVYLLLLLGALQLSQEWRSIGLFTSYLLIFISAASQSGTIKYRPQGVWRMLKQVTGKQLFIYLLFFCLLFLLRTGRLLKSNSLFIWAILGFIFVFAIWMITLSKRRKTWRMPLYVNVFTFLHGIVGNFLFLFGSLYVGARFGQSSLSSHIYIPYTIGLFISMISGSFLERKLGNCAIRFSIAGLIFCALLFCFDGTLLFAVAGISFFNAGLNRWLSRHYQAQTVDAIENSCLAKYATQSKGSLTHQFLLMTLLWGMVLQEHLPKDFIFQLSDTAVFLQQDKIAALLEPVKWLSAVSIMLLFGVGFLFFKKEIDSSIDVCKEQ